MNRRVLLIGRALADSAVACALGNSGLWIDVADDIGEALEQLQANSYQSCLLDQRAISKEERDGLILLREISLSLPVVLVVPAGSASSATTECLETGADDWVFEDAEPSVVEEVLHRISVRRWVMLRSNLTESCRVLVTRALRPGLELHSLEDAAMALGSQGYSTTVAEGPQAMLEAIRVENVHVIVIGSIGSSQTVRDALSAARRYDPRLQVLTSNPGSWLADSVSPMHYRNVSFLFEPITSKSIVTCVEAAWQRYQNAEAQFASGRRATSRISLLVVEPGRNEGSLAELLATDESLSVDSAVNLVEAQKLLRRRRYGLLLFDVNAAVGSPLGAALELRSIAPRTPILIATGSGCERLARDLIASGAEEVLPRDAIAADTLLARVQNLVGRAEHRSRLERVALELMARNASLREVILRCADGIIVVDDDGRIIFANPAAAVLLGASSRHSIGEPLGQVLPREGDAEVQVRHPISNEVLVLEVRVVQIPWDGQQARLATLRDITSRRQAEGLRTQLVQSERLVAIGQLAAGVTHEINNPASFVVANLTAMQRQLGVLRQFTNDLSRRRDLQAGADLKLAHRAMEDLEEMLSENLEGMERIRGIVKDLRTFARIERDEVEWVDLNEVVNVACNFAFNEIRHRARLVKDLGRLPPLAASRGKLAQVMVNLLVNAAQSIVEGDADRNRITVTTEFAGGVISIAVEDTGIGMSPDVLAQIFDPFFTTKSPDQGTGLGLSLCADIVRKHMGELRVSSQPAIGSRFQVRLPTRNGLVAVTGAPQLLSEPPHSIGKLRVLIIDDEPLILRAYRRMLAPHEVLVAAGGAEGLRILERDRRFDLVLCDLMMPDVDGPILYQTVGEFAPELCQRIVFCSGGAFTERTKSFLGMVQNIVLEKPLTLGMFHAAVRRLAYDAESETEAPGIRLSAS